MRRVHEVWGRLLLTAVTVFNSDVNCNPDTLPPPAGQIEVLHVSKLRIPTFY